MVRVVSTLYTALLFLCAGLHAGAQTIVCFGDSLTAGTGSTLGHAYPDFLEQDLKTDGYQARLINQGVPGETTKDALARLPAVLATKPAIVIVALGANDGLMRQPASGIEANLGIIIEQLQQAKIRVVLAGIDMPHHLNNGPAEDYIAQFDPIYPSLAAKYKVVLVPSLLKDVYGVMGLMSPDYLHPNGAGYEHVAQNILPYIEPLLKK